MGYVGFDRAIYKSFKDIKDSRPLHMLNLVELKEEAIYPDGSILTGVEAYKRYGKESENSKMYSVFTIVFSSSSVLTIGNNCSDLSNWTAAFLNEL